MQAPAVGDVVEHGLRKGIRLLEDHADAPAQRDHVHARAVDVLAVEEQLARRAAAGDQVVHAVDRPQQRALAAAAGADDGRHLAGWEIERDVLHRLVVAVEEGEILAGDMGFAVRFRRQAPSSERSDAWRDWVGFIG